MSILSVTPAPEAGIRSKAPLQKGIGPREIAGWCLLALTLSCAASRLQPGLSNDSYQYISTAQNLARGRGLATSLVYFDTERSSGRIPAPLTTFAPGLPMLLAGLNRAGVSPEIAGFLISLVATIAVIPLICRAGRLMELRVAAVRFALLAFMLDSVTPLEATSVATEALFMLCGFAALTLLMSFLRSELAGSLASGSFLLGLSVWIRYAGLFLFLAVALFFGIRLLMARDRGSLRAALWLLLPACMVFGLFARNLALSGSWKGGNTKLVDFGWKAGITKVMSGSTHLFLGDGRPGLLHVIFLLGIGLAAVTLVYRLLAARRLPSLSVPVLLPLFCVAFYWAAILYMAVHSVISVGARMFYPLLPWITLLAGAAICWLTAQKPGAPWKRMAQCGMAMAAIGFVVLNVEDVITQPARWLPSPAERFAAGSNPSLLGWIHHYIPGDAVIVAEDGQATGYVLQHPVVSMASTQYSAQRWGETEVRQLMERYGAKYLLIYPGLDPEVDPAPADSDFLKALDQGREPAWLQVAAENSRVRIYRRASMD